ncbi:MAG: transcription antitermination factor NusB [Bdellovibrionales bacterium]|nr:transcription antitermination factor NusB [Bdellovibrionales bacterium]
MNHSRHHAREIALQILYRYDLNASAAKGEAAVPVPTGLALADDLKKHFEHFQVTEGVREFAAELVAGTLKNIPELDLEIEKYANNWKISRMALIDRNLLRMALFEMSRFKDIPAAITIDEAVELAKQFGTADTSGFVNAILDSYRKTSLAG